MDEPFDQVAEHYDDCFTCSAIGRMQRNQVWKYIDQLVIPCREPAVLELNCGTGEDALYFQAKGFNVIATDISEEMVKIAAKKMAGKVNGHVVMQCDMLRIGSVFEQNGFDFIFSDFGGINCIPPEKLEHLALDISKLLKPGGRFICVVMPRFCIWDTLYFLLKFKFITSMRRWGKKALSIRTNKMDFPVWYYNPKHLAGYFSYGFKVVSVKPIGLFIPPSYLNSYFLKHPGMLAALGKMEYKIENISSLARFSDHFIIDMVKVAS